MEKQEYLYLKNYNKNNVAFEKVCLVNSNSNFIMQYAPTKGDVIYIHPDSVIPRFKMKQFCETHEVKVTRDVKKANIIFSCKKAFESFTISTHSPHLFKKSSFYNFVSTYNLHFYNEFVEELKNDSQDCFIIPYNFVYNCNSNYYGNVLGPGQSYEFKEEGDYDEDYKGYKRIDYFEIDDDKNLILISSTDFDEYNFWLNKSYDEKALTSILNNSLVLDQDMYEGLCNLFASSDTSNHIMAMESMANCDYRESASYLLLLFSEYYKQMYASKTRNHVNFKSLLQFFDITLHRYMDLDGIFRRLLDLKLVTKYHIDILTPKVIKESKGYFPTKYFEFSKVIPKTEIQNILDKEQELLQSKEEETNITW